MRKVSKSAKWFKKLFVIREKCISPRNSINRFRMVKLVRKMTNSNPRHALDDFYFTTIKSFSYSHGIE